MMAARCRDAKAFGMGWSLCVPSRILLLAGALYLVAGCASSIEVKTYVNPEIRIPAAPTYAWSPKPPARTKPAELDPRATDPALNERIRRAIESALEAKGFRREAAATAQFLVTYRVGVRDREQWTQSSGGPAGMRSMTMRQIEYTEGGLRLSLFERSTGTLAYQALGLDDVTEGRPRSEAELRDVVLELLQDLPLASR